MSDKLGILLHSEKFTLKLAQIIQRLFYILHKVYGGANKSYLNKCRKTMQIKEALKEIFSPSIESGPQLKNPARAIKMEFINIPHPAVRMNKTKHTVLSTINTIQPCIERPEKHLQKTR